MGDKEGKNPKNLKQDPSIQLFEQGDLFWEFRRVPNRSTEKLDTQNYNGASFPRASFVASLLKYQALDQQDITGHLEK